MDTLISSINFIMELMLEEALFINAQEVSIGDGYILNQMLKKHPLEGLDLYLIKLINEYNTDALKIDKLIDYFSMILKKHYRNNVPFDKLQIVSKSYDTFYEIALSYGYIFNNGMFKKRCNKGFYFVTFKHFEELSLNLNNECFWNVFINIVYGQVLDHSGINYETFQIESNIFLKNYFQHRVLYLTINELQEETNEKLIFPFKIIDKSLNLKKEIKEYKRKHREKRSYGMVLGFGIPVTILWGISFGFAMDKALFSMPWYYMLLFIMFITTGFGFEFLMRISNNPKYPFLLNEKENKRMIKIYNKRNRKLQN